MGDKIDVDGMIFRVGLIDFDKEEVDLFYDPTGNNDLDFLDSFDSDVASELENSDYEIYHAIIEQIEYGEFAEDKIFVVFDNDYEDIARGKLFMVKAKSSLEAKLRVVKRLAETNSIFYDSEARHVAYPIGYVIQNLMFGHIHTAVDFSNAADSFEKSDDKIRIIV